MKYHKRTLHTKLFLYLGAFSSIILLLFWLAQYLFFNRYYEHNKILELDRAADKIILSYNNNDFKRSLDAISYQSGICIEIESDTEFVYRSSSYNRGCLVELGEDSIGYKNDFINSGLNKKTYKIVNKRFNNNALVYGIKLDNNVYAYISISLDPLDSTTIILRKQLFLISCIVLLLSFVIAYFIAKIITTPIVKISNKAKELAHGNYDVNFKSNTDIDEIHNLETILDKTKEEMCKIDELRRDLMANVGHDLKTPLTMIKAYAEMVRDISYKDDEKRNNHLNIIIEESDRLNSLVNDILTLSNIQSGAEDLVLENFDLDELIKSILKHYSILKETEGYEFIYNGVGKIMVKADRKRIEQVMYNIINNAINYTGKDNKVFIDVKLKKGAIRVEIRDTGAGIDKSQLDMIWDKYYHTDKKHKRNMIGTGLGLSIVKNILEKHNYNYGVNSIIGKGTTFYFEISKK